MTNEQKVEAWVDTATAHNYGKADAWILRVEIDGRQLVEQVVKRLDAIGVRISPNGRPLEYVVSFPSSSAREACDILVDGGARLCSDQALAPVP